MCSIPFNHLTTVASILNHFATDYISFFFFLSFLLLNSHAIESPTFRDQQRYIGVARLLGFLHSRSIVPSSILLDMLYQFINHGHEIPQGENKQKYQVTSD